MHDIVHKLWELRGVKMDPKPFFEMYLKNRWNLSSKIQRNLEATKAHDQWEKRLHFICIF